jgi:hypothetical protein
MHDRLCRKARTEVTSVLDVFLSDLVPPAHDARAGLPGPQVSALARTVEGPLQA